jgi:TonB family protein
MLKYIITLVFLVGVLEASSQRLVVMSFRRIQTENDKSVIIPKIDKDVKGCIVIRVINAKPGLTFDFGDKGRAVSTKREKDILWLWIPAEVETATISQKQLGVLKNYHFGMDLTEGKVYEMVLEKEKELDHSEVQNESQKVNIFSCPSHASLSIDNYPAGKTPFYGSLTKGTHKLRLVLKDETLDKSVDIKPDGYYATLKLAFKSVIDTSENRPLDSYPFSLNRGPEYKGGLDSLFAFLKRNIKYPAKAIESGIQGTVFVQFVASETGKISHVKCIRGIGGGCDEEAVRVAKMMPNWNPGLTPDEPEPVMFGIPIKFQLPKKE